MCISTIPRGIDSVLNNNNQNMVHQMENPTTLSKSYGNDHKDSQLITTYPFVNRGYSKFNPTNPWKNIPQRISNFEQEQSAISEKLLNIEAQILQNELQQNVTQHQILKEKNIQLASRLSKLVPIPKTRSDVIVIPKENSALSDVDIVAVNKDQLEKSGCYYGQMSWQESETILARCSAGTFLVRDSQYPGCHFSLSFQRGVSEGPTSIRIQLNAGKFSLNADNEIKPFMPQFDSIIELLGHYMIQGTSQSVPVLLTNPLCKSSSPAYSKVRRESTCLP